MASPSATAPAPELLEIDAHCTDSCLVVRVSGELDLVSSDRIEETAATLLHDGVRDVFIDVEGLTYCGSAGLRAFLALHEIARGRGGSLTIQHASPMVHRLLDLTGMAEIMLVRPAPETS